jgi:hypothetical protein
MNGSEVVFTTLPRESSVRAEVLWLAGFCAMQAWSLSAGEGLNPLVLALIGGIVSRVVLKAGVPASDEMLGLRLSTALLALAFVYGVVVEDRLWLRFLWLTCGLLFIHATIAPTHKVILTSLDLALPGFPSKRKIRYADITSLQPDIAKHASLVHINLRSARGPLGWLDRKVTLRLQDGEVDAFVAEVSRRRDEQNYDLS